MKQAMQLLGAYLDGHTDDIDRWMVLDAYLWLVREHDGDHVADALMSAGDWQALEQRYIDCFGGLNPP